MSGLAAEFYEDAAGGFRWRLQAENGEIVASGESYTTEASARRGFKDAAKAFLTAVVWKDRDRRVAVTEPGKQEPGNAAERFEQALAEQAAKQKALGDATAEAFAIGVSRGEARPIWPARAFPWATKDEEATK